MPKSKKNSNFSDFFLNKKLKSVKIQGIGTQIFFSKMKYSLLVFRNKTPSCKINIVAPNIDFHGGVIIK